MDKIILLSGRIDSSNVDKEEEKINKELDEYRTIKSNNQQTKKNFIKGERLWEQKKLKMKN